jgi:hypothetical protein
LGDENISKIQQILKNINYQESIKSVLLNRKSISKIVISHDGTDIIENESSFEAAMKFFQVILKLF